MGRGTPTVNKLRESRVVTQARPDAQQAQVYQGWYAPALDSEHAGGTAGDEHAAGRRRV